jgi:hypothetical protein
MLSVCRVICVQNFYIRASLFALFQKSPVTFLRSASALDRLLVLCDATLYVINASDLSPLSLSGSPKFKGVTACCVNENPNTDDPFSVQVGLEDLNERKILSFYKKMSRHTLAIPLFPPCVIW